MKLKEMYEQSSISKTLYMVADQYDIEPCTVFSFAKILGRDAEYSELIKYVEEHVECKCDEFEMEEF